MLHGLVLHFCWRVFLIILVFVLFFVSGSLRDIGDLALQCRETLVGVVSKTRQKNQQPCTMTEAVYTDLDREPISIESVRVREREKERAREREGSG